LLAKCLSKQTQSWFAGGVTDSASISNIQDLIDDWRYTNCKKGNQEKSITEDQSGKLIIIK